jgi:hypothetical protein
MCCYICGNNQTAHHAYEKTGVFMLERDLRRMGEEQNRFGNGKEG